MRHSIFLFSMLFATHVFGQSTLTVEVELNRPKDGGTVRIALCKGADAYDKEKGCIVAFGKAEGALVRIELKDLEPGQYAIKAFHDVNDNGKMDFNWAGMPKEPYGFSNNAMGTMAAPKFSQASFMVRPGANVTRFRMRG
jgi:uncharacterized protein (DUF2141 family)